MVRLGRLCVTRWPMYCSCRCLSYVTVWDCDIRYHLPLPLITTSSVNCDAIYMCTSNLLFWLWYIFTCWYPQCHENFNILDWIYFSEMKSPYIICIFRVPYGMENSEIKEEKKWSGKRLDTFFPHKVREMVFRWVANTIKYDDQLFRAIDNLFRSLSMNEKCFLWIAMQLLWCKLFIECYGYADKSLLIFVHKWNMRITNEWSYFGQTPERGKGIPCF